ncbi:hypothetical protein FQN53_001250 [Emmonsiellopsis sp. PD_33]|nr:hypothetical protein FQN53_001250 [Emmonsiellopsis sp. PD_33]
METPDDEKGLEIHREDVSLAVKYSANIEQSESPVNAAPDRAVYGIDEAHQRKVIRRIDLRLLPILGLMYSISLVDRTNLGLALVAGMQEDLGLAVGDRYTIIVMVFFVAYIIFEIPSNLILPKAGAANWLAFLGISFGALLIAMGFTKSWGTMALCRALLGVMEAGFLPGIFIIEGAITSGVCLLGWFIIIDFPSKADSFLKPEEKQFVLDRINNDRGDAEEDRITASRILYHLKDWKLYFWAFNLMASTLPGYAYSYFLPVILKEGMGFSTTESQLLSAPPYVLAAVMTYISGWFSDKYHIRGPIVAIHQLLTAVGMLITAYGKVNGARYFGAFLGIGFLQYCVPGVLTFQANNITSHSKRSVASATCIIGGGLGGIFASIAFKSSESPKYTTGIWVTFAVSIASIILILIMDVYFWKINKRAKKGDILIEGMAHWYYTA